MVDLFLIPVDAVIGLLVLIPPRLYGIMTGHLACSRGDTARTECYQAPMLGGLRFKRTAKSGDCPQSLLA